VTFTQSSRRFLLFSSMAVIAGTGLAACNSGPVPESPPQVDFSKLQMVAIPINVSTINTHIREMKVGGAFVADPVEVMQKYLKARYEPRGMQDSLEVTIEEASVTKTEKAADSKVARYFNVGGQDVYNITLRVRFDYVETGGRLIYGRVYTAKRQMGISQHASIAEREQREVEGLEKMLTELDVRIRTMILNDMRLGL
jgi:hypothetical protein